MENFIELTTDEATSVSGGRYPLLNAIFSAINNGTYAGGSIIIYPADGAPIMSMDYVVGSPSLIVVNGEVVYSGKPRPLFRGIWRSA